MQNDTYATKPPKNATGPPPIRRIFRWHESKSDVRACVGGVVWACMPIIPPDVGPWPTICAGDLNIVLHKWNTLFLRPTCFLNSKIFFLFCPTNFKRFPPFLYLSTRPTTSLEFWFFLRTERRCSPYFSHKTITISKQIFSDGDGIQFSSFIAPSPLLHKHTIISRNVSVLFNTWIFD